MAEPVYRSQWDADALMRREDCGPACVAMILGPSVKINDLSTHVMPTDVGTDANDLVHLLKDHGVEAWTWYGSGIPKLPAICLVKYSGFNRASVQDTNFLGWHWLIWLERRDDGSAVVLDPDWWAPRRDEGDHKIYSKAEMDRAFIPYGSSKVAVLWKGEESITMAKIRITSGAQTFDVDLPVSISEVPTSTDIWQASFFVGSTPTGASVWTTTYPGPALNTNWGTGSPNPLVPVENFSAIFTMQHTFAAGVWQWSVNSDDGFQLLVDGQVVPGLDGWIEQSAASKTYVGHVTLTAGLHSVMVRYFEKGGLAELHVSAPTPF